MNFFKALLNWKLWLGILLGVAFLIGLWFFTFDSLKNFTNHGVQVEVPDLSGLNVYEAMERLDELKLLYEIDSVRYTEDFPPHAILEFFPSEGSKVKPGRRIFIKSNPSTWAPVELPDLMDKSIRLAMTQLHLRGFSLGDTIYVEDPARDAVLGVLYAGDTIHAGKLLPKGAQIDLILGRGFRMDVPVPNVEGLDLTSAKIMLKHEYFDIGQVYYLDGNRDTINTKVVFQEPPPGDYYDEGLPVSLWLSKKNPLDLKDELDSLKLVYRRKLDERDSLFYNSIRNAAEIDVRDMSEDIRNAIEFDMNTNEEMRPEIQPRPEDNEPVIDTSGISID